MFSLKNYRKYCSCWLVGCPVVRLYLSHLTLVSMAPTVDGLDRCSYLHKSSTPLKKKAPWTNYDGCHDSKHPGSCKSGGNVLCRAFSAITCSWGTRTASCCVQCQTKQLAMNENNCLNLPCVNIILCIQGATRQWRQWLCWYGIIFSLCELGAYSETILNSPETGQPGLELTDPKSLGVSNIPYLMCERRSSLVSKYICIIPILLL
jgi:hypothetical protein